MKNLNFELVFKIIVLIQLTLILSILLFREDSSNSQAFVEKDKIGRYKEIKIKSPTRFGGDEERVLILDTETGETTIPE